MHCVTACVTVKKDAGVLKEAFPELADSCHLIGVRHPEGGKWPEPNDQNGGKVNIII